jgi:hypothetical protein
MQADDLPFGDLRLFDRRSIRLDELRPTQMSVGYREVARKRHCLGGLAGTKAHRNSKLVLVVLGPHGHPYIIDGHHLALAYLHAGHGEADVEVQADFQKAAQTAFWTGLELRQWCHPYDAAGVRRPFTEIPTHLGGLQDDPYRSLAGALRRRGAYAKTKLLFSEFAWADYLRLRILPEQIAESFEAALDVAEQMARHSDAGRLPGWRGPIRQSQTEG